MFNRRGLIALLIIQGLVTGCQRAPHPPMPVDATAASTRVTDVEPKSLATPSATTIAVGSPTTQPTFAPTPSVPRTTSTPRLETPTARPSPTAEATLTPQPTVTVPRANTSAARISIEQPVSGMFLPVPVPVRGRVENVSGGEVRLLAQTPNGESIGLPPVLAATTPVTSSLVFSGTLELGYAPTPRSLLVTAEYLAEDRVRAFLQQPVNAIGRFGRVQYTVIEHPRPFTRNAEPAILVRGAAPGPPKSVLVRLLDAQDQVIESVPASLGWYQPGLPCDFSASIRNVREGVTIQVLSLGDDDKVIEQARVQLGQPVQ